MPKFSPNTVIELIKAFHFSTHAQLQQLALQFGVADILGEGGIQKKETRLMQHLIQNPDLQGPQGSCMIVELTEHLLKERCQIPQNPKDPDEAFPDLLNALKQNGYVVSDYKLHAMLPETIPVAQSQDEVTRLLDTHAFDTAKGHLEQAIAAHTRGEWAAANAQLRSFIEELFDRMAEKLSEGQTASLNSSHARREWLAKCNPPLFDPALNEWEIGDKGGFVQGLWKRLHPQGSHPGLSDEADCTFRLHIVIIVGEHFLRRFDARYP